MKRAAVALLVLATLLCAADKKSKNKKPKPPDVEVVELKVRRSAGMISLDGTVLNSGLRPLNTLTLIFKMRSPDQKAVINERGDVDGPLDPGETSEFRFDMKDFGRAVDVVVDAEDGPGRELVVSKPGPYVVE
jgi:hypothetical protein